jgi:transposase-like protein
MVTVALKCPFCESEDIGPYGTSNGKKRYTCKNPECPHKTFYAEYRYGHIGIKKRVADRVCKKGVL